MAKIEEVMKIEFCIGSRRRVGIDPSEFDGELITDGSYFIELYTIAEEEKDFVFIDTNCQSNPNSTAEAETTHELYLAIPYPGTLSRTVRLCNITLNTSQPMTTWTCTIRTVWDCNIQQYRKKKMSIHRLINIVANHNGFGFNNHTPLREYLQLQKGETCTSNRRFEYHDFTNKRSERLIRRRLTELQHKEWLNVKVASICDIDHMIGRSKVWMNSNFFTWMVSHQYNNQLSYVRLFFGDWLYGFSGKTKYKSGND